KTADNFALSSSSPQPFSWTYDDELGDTFSTSSQEKLIGIERRVQQVKELLEVETVKTANNFALSSSSPQPFSWTYDVFLCFKSNDTCKDFADQLEYALEEQGIYVFSSDKGLAKDESLASEHLKAIEESCISAVILSRNFASDSYCLNNMLKIMNRNEENGQLILTIFYDVDPSDVRNQKGVFVEALMQNKSEEVKLWSEALVKASSLAGWYLNGTPKSHEGMCIKTIVDMISRRLDCLPSSVDDNLIGIDVHMKEVMKLMELESGGVQMLGIWGMGGIGKTTIARAVYDQVSTYFDGSCFIENIREVSKYYGLEQCFKVFPEKEIEDTLKISFDGLDDDTKDIFLDVACLFNGMQKDKVVRILDSCELSGDNGIRLLEQKSLICIDSNGCIYMHNLLEQMGKDIDRQMYPDEPMKRSRLWQADEISDILMDKTGTEKISAIVVDNMHNQDAIDMTEAFRGMKNLRSLYLRGCSNLRLTRLMIDVSPATPTLRNLAQIDLSAYRASSLRYSLHSLEHPKGFPLHKALVNMIRDLRLHENLNVNILGPVSDRDSESESQTSQELID
ncbi:TMV resistance protein N, partial [Tanacetum coccineum]